MLLLGPEIAVDYLHRMTLRVAHAIEQVVRELPRTRVLIAGLNAESFRSPLPYLDWAGLVLSRDPLETFLPIVSNRVTPSALEAISAAEYRSPHTLLLDSGLILRPTVASRKVAGIDAHLRAVQSPVTDPIPFALVSGQDSCWFSDLPGWSARDCALRAVTEFEIRLRETSLKTLPPGTRLGVLLAGMRAMVFKVTLRAGEPAVPATTDATIALLGDLFPGSRSVLESTVTASTDTSFARVRDALLELLSRASPS